MERKQKISMYKKGNYKKNAEKISKSYNPSKRREKYEKEKEKQAKIWKKKLEVDENSEADFYQDKEVNKLVRRKERQKAYQSDWYKENAERIKKSRRERYEKEKETQAEILKKKLDEDENSDLDFYQDKDVIKFVDERKRQKSYKKEWYEKNAEKIKKRKKDNYDPVARKKQFERDKVKMKRADEEDWWLSMTEDDINKLQRESKENNSKCKEQTSTRLEYNVSRIKHFNVDHETDMKTKKLRNEILAVHKEVENNIDILKKTALKNIKDGVKMIDFQTFDRYQTAVKWGAELDAMFVNVCDPWHALQLKMDVKFKEIAQQRGESFDCQFCIDHFTIHTAK